MMAPHPPNEIAGPAYGPPVSGHTFGFDYLGRDVLSRYLSGGRTAIFLAFVATALGTVLGVIVGLASAYRRGWFDEVAMRGIDVLLAFPILIFVLVVISGFGASLSVIVIAVALTFAPRIARIARAAALEIVDLGYVEAAKARGERSYYIAAREILPNMGTPILVDFGIRVTQAIIVVSSVSFLGFGIQPPTADWGLMVSENRAGITVQPWPIVLPVVTIALLTIGLNMVIDGFERADRGADKKVTETNAG
jgi:peptide/nickel transport system permease protein